MTNVAMNNKAGVIGGAFSYADYHSEDTILYVLLEFLKPCGVCCNSGKFGRG